MYLSVFYLITCVSLLYISEIKYSQQRGGGASGTILGIFIFLSIVGGGIGLYHHFKSDASPSITPSPTNSVEKKTQSQRGVQNQTQTNAGNTNAGNTNAGNTNAGNTNAGQKNKIHKHDDYDVEDLLNVLSQYGEDCSENNHNKKAREACDLLKNKKHKVNVENLLQVLGNYGMKKPTPSPR